MSDLREKILHIVSNHKDDYYAVHKATDKILALLPQWIPVEERLPENDGYVQCLMGRSNLPFNAMFYRLSGFSLDMETVEPKYWQPLPTPPKES